MDLLGTAKIIYTAPGYRRKRQTYARESLAQSGGGPHLAVLAMEKTATTTIRETLAKYLPDRHPHQAHHAQRDTFRGYAREVRRMAPGWAPKARLGGSFLAKHPATEESPWEVVTLVREPVARLVSAVFQRSSVSGINRSDAEVVRDAVVNHRRRDLHERWFGDEIEALGVDVYAEPFDHERGWVTFTSPRARVLVLKNERLDAAPAALTEFFGAEIPELVAANIGAEKSYAEAYRRFLAEPRLPESFLDALLGSRYARHFYTDAERERARTRWM